MTSSRTILFALVLVIGTVVGVPEFCGLPLKERRIINGFPAEEFQFPWQVPLFIKSIYSNEEPNFICSGTIISTQSILTAAHCLPPSKDVFLNYDGFFGLRNGSTNYTSGELDRMDDYVIHPYYSPENNHIYDLGIIHLLEPLEFAEGIWPICLPNPNEVYVGAPVTLSGWGQTEVGMVSENLLTINETVISNAECADVLDDHFTEIGYPGYVNVLSPQICAETPGRTGCFGDSGGPLIFLEDENEPAFYTQVGIVSWGSPQCLPGLPNVYASVPNQLYWILKEMRGETLPAPWR